MTESKCHVTDPSLLNERLTNLADLLDKPGVALSSARAFYDPEIASSLEPLVQEIRNRRQLMLDKTDNSKEGKVILDHFRELEDLQLHVEQWIRGDASSDYKALVKSRLVDAQAVESADSLSYLLSQEGYDVSRLTLSLEQYRTHRWIESNVLAGVELDTQALLIDYVFINAYLRSVREVLCG